LSLDCAGTDISVTSRMAAAQSVVAVKGDMSLLILPPAKPNGKRA